MQQIDYHTTAKVLDCSERTVKRFVAANLLKPFRLGHRTVRFDLDGVLRFKRERERGIVSRKLKLIVRVSTNGQKRRVKVSPPNGHKARNSHDPKPRTIRRRHSE